MIVNFNSLCKAIVPAMATLALGFLPHAAAAETPLDRTVMDRKADHKAIDAAAEEEWAYSLGLQAYVFGMPLVVFEREYALRTDVAKIERIRHLCPCAQVNQIGHNEALADADQNLPYSPNNDTTISGGPVDATDEPIIVSLPDIEDRYWSLEVADPYTENMFYLGSRASGGKGGHHAFIGPDWQGELPEGVIPHRMNYNASMTALRIGVKPDDAEDLAAVNALQRQTQFTSLENFRAGRFGQAPMPSSARNRGQAKGQFAFFQTMADLLDRYPPEAKHQAVVSQFAAIGIVPGQAFNPEALSEPTKRGLLRALQQGPGLMNWKGKRRGEQYGNWDNLHEGRWGYNYIARAVSALMGLFVHDREEALYFSAFTSDDGQFLDGGKAYRLHFSADKLPPPTQDYGFWSVTMYGPDFQLVKNSINRFSIGDRTAGLEYNDDGSLDVLIQNRPPKGRESNWLPSPEEGLFRVIYRIYLPEEPARNPDTLDNYLPRLQHFTE